MPEAEPTPRVPGSWRQRGVRAGIVFGLLLVVASPQHYRDAADNRAPNEEARVLAALALADHGSLALEPALDDTKPGWRARLEKRRQLPNIDLAVRDGRFYTDKAPGTSLLSVPVVALLHGLGAEPGYGTLVWLLTLLVCGLPTALFALYLARWLRRSLPDLEAAELIALGLVVATPWAAYAGLFFGHALAATLIGLGTLLALGPLHRVSDGATTPDRPGAPDRRGPLLGGLCLGGAVLTEYPTAALAAIVVVALLVDPQRRRRAAWVIAGAAPMAATLALWNTLAFGGPLKLSYGFKAAAQFQEIIDQGVFGFGAPSADNLFGILLGPERGLLFVAPWLLIGFAGVVVAARDPRISRAWKVALIGAIVGFPLLVSGFVDWKAGRAFGPRHLTPMLPLLAVSAAIAWRRMTQIRWANALGTGAIASSALVCIVSAWVFPYASETLVNPWGEVDLPVLFAAGPAPVIWGGGMAALGLALALTGIAWWWSARRGLGASIGGWGGATLAVAVHLLITISPSTGEERAHVIAILDERALVHHLHGETDQVRALDETIRRLRRAPAAPNRPPTAPASPPPLPSGT